MSAALSVDLAFKRYSDIGIVALHGTPDRTVITPIRMAELGVRGSPDPEVLTEFLLSLADDLGVTAIGLDGPQGWKHSENGYQHSRACEALLHTQGKTGTPGVTKPAAYLPFIEFSIATFDALHRRAWSRYGGDPESRVAVETFPTAAWKAMGLKALPGKAKASYDHVRDWTASLMGLGGVEIADKLSHDELSAAISGLGILALAQGRRESYAQVGMPPFEKEGYWFEGFIVNPRGSAS